VLCRSRKIKTGILIVIGVCAFLFLRLPASAPSLFADGLCKSAERRSRIKLRYDPRYYDMNYPNGDIPSDRGACTDFVIRTYRDVGIDLQKDVREQLLDDSLASDDFEKAQSLNSSIDHRRVKNLEHLFIRKGKVLPISMRYQDYSPGDLIVWNSGNHIGIVTRVRDYWSGRLLVAHQSLNGTRLEDVLFKWPITGHYQYEGILNAPLEDNVYRRDEKYSAILLGAKSSFGDNVDLNLVP
jgi:uncharacterized protein